MTNPTIFKPTKYTDSPATLADLFRGFPEKRFNKGDYIIPFQKTPNDIIFVLTGKSITYTYDETEHRNLANNYILEHDFINLYSLSGETPKQQFAVAVAKTTIKAIPLLTFHRLLSESSFLQQAISKKLLRNLALKQTNLHRMVTMSSRQRILHFLVAYCRDAGQRMGYEWLIRPRLSTTQIGELTYSSRQSSSTLLNDLKRQNIIYFNRKYIIIRDLKALQSFCQQ